MKAWMFGICIGQLVMAMLLGSCMPALQTDTVRKSAYKDTSMTQETTYPTKFCRPDRGCMIPVLPKAGGQVAWSSQLDFASPQAKADLLISEGHVVVTGADEIILFSSGGDRLWKRVKRMGSPAAVANGLIYYESREHYLEAVGRENQPALDKAPFPSVDSDEFEVTLLWPRRTDFVSAVYLAEPTYDTEESEVDAPEPELSLRLTNYGDIIGKWGEDYEGVPELIPLYIPELENLVFSIGEVVTVDLKLEQETSRFKAPLEPLVDWSGDSAGILCITGYHDDRKTLLAISLDGQEKWRWTDVENPDRWVAAQPPIRSGRRVYALTSNRVLAIEQGRLLWEYQVKQGPAKHGSSLADGSVLVTAGRTLVHVDPSGNERFSVSVDKDILSMPVADAAGDIYVATATHLVKIK